MAQLIDKEPNFEGEKKVWNSFDQFLPQHWVVYNNRTINGREYDFCVIAPEMGLFIVEVKGWLPSSVLTVIDQNTIFLANYEKPAGSPRGQARGYRFDLLNKIRKELGMNPLVMSLVCYPCISESEYYEKGLNIVSEENETIFQEDLLDSAKLYAKFRQRYDIDKAAKHDELTQKEFALIRHHFEPNFDLKEVVERLNPGYSRLRTFPTEITDDEIKEIVREYFKGIKEIVFVSNSESLKRIVNCLNQNFLNRNIYPNKNNLSIGQKEISLQSEQKSFSIFNFEIECVENICDYPALLVEEGRLSDLEKSILEELALKTDFNFQQYEIEHAPTDQHILVRAGAGTGKTFSMVSRIAYLCNKTTDAITDLANEIAMITFTNDAAKNMKRRVKAMFMNYFVLTSNEKYMHFIEDMSQIQISTIHKFAISMLQKNCMKLGIGSDSQISSETYERKKLYHSYLNEYLKTKIEEDEDFIRQLPMPTYEMEDLLLSFSNKLFDQSVDIKKLTSKDFGGTVDSILYFNELISKVVIKAETDYASTLKENNLIGLRECMVQIHDLAKSHQLMKQGYEFKFVFVDEFQDTDDMQIETIVELQKLFGSDCRLFLVGDLKQSIYRFRGASLSAFDNIIRLTGENHWQFFALNRNYRTDRLLLEKFHSVFGKMGRSDNLPYNPEQDRLKSRVSKGIQDDELFKMVETHANNQDLFYEQLFEEINHQISLIEEEETIHKLSPEEKTIAILVRYNFQINNILQMAAKDPNSNFEIKVAQIGDLYRLPSTLDLYKLVLAVTHPRNSLYLMNLIESNYVSLKVNKAKFGCLPKSEKTKALVRVLDQYFISLIGKSWEHIVTDFEVRPVLVVLREIYQSTKPWLAMMNTDSQKRYKENYDCLIEKITQRYSRDYLTINAVKEFLQIGITTYQEEESRKKTEDNSSVQVICSTIHKSKGLEYGTVILPFTSEDISDLNRGRLSVNVVDGKVFYGISMEDGGIDYSDGYDLETEKKEKVREESRILYVAMTRAIRNLVWFKNLDTSKEESWGKYMEVKE